MFIHNYKRYHTILVIIETYWKFNLEFAEFKIIWLLANWDYLTVYCPIVMPIIISWMTEGTEDKLFTL